MEGVSPADITRAGQMVEATYILRLFAEFEGVLENHLRSNHPLLAVPKAEGLNMDPLIRDINLLRHYRNDLIHTGDAPKVVFTFRNALSRLNNFLARLPEPLT